jgi:hypothetical protein
MDDPNQLLVTNLIEALQQLQRYIVIGLGASVSALALTGKSTPNNRVDVKVIPVPVAPDTARLILLAVCVLVGAMASYAAQSVTLIAERLRPSPALLAAACTFPSVATSPYVLVRVLAALLPVIISMAAIVRSSWAYGKVGRKSILGWAILFVFAYFYLVVALIRPACLAN